MTHGVASAAATHQHSFSGIEALHANATLADFLNGAAHATGVSQPISGPNAPGRPATLMDAVAANAFHGAAGGHPASHPFGAPAAASMAGSMTGAPAECGYGSPKEAFYNNMVPKSIQKWSPR